jgi:predicted branched-subunit amino acid permease
LMLSARAEGRTVGYWYLVGAGMMMLLVWLMATIAGVTFAAAIPEPRALGTDFAFTAAFIAIARSLWTGHRDLIPWVTSFVVVALLIVPGLVAGSWAMIAGGVAGAMVAGLKRNG